MSNPRKKDLHRKRERSYAGPVCGVDEVGRGPLAGPVVAAAVILPVRLPRTLSHMIDDSKKVSPWVREVLAAQIGNISAVGIGIASVEEIDTINILQASLLAMRRAVAALPITPIFALVDGNQCPRLDIPRDLIIGGDGKELSIAAASIIAKVYRDRLMRQLHDDHPHYGWAENAGYPTLKHRNAIKQHGVCIHHRRSFSLVRQVLEWENYEAAE